MARGRNHLLTDRALEPQARSLEHDALEGQPDRLPGGLRFWFRTARWPNREKVPARCRRPVAVADISTSRAPRALGTPTSPRRERVVCLDSSTLTASSARGQAEVVLVKGKRRDRSTWAPSLPWRRIGGRLLSQIR